MTHESNKARPFVMQPSYVKAISKLPVEHRGEAYRVITEYGCFGMVPEDATHWAIMAIFEAIRPSIDSSASGTAKRSANNPYGRAGRPTVSTAEVSPSTAGENKEPDLFEICEKNNANNSILIEQNNSFKSKEIEFNSINNSNNSIKNENLIELNQERKEKETENEKESFPPAPPYKEKDKEKEIEKKEPRSRSDRAREREIFLKDFFLESRRDAVTKQADNLGITVERYFELVNQVLDDWEINGPLPAPDNETRTKMLCTVRKKHAALGRQQSPKFKIIASTVSQSSEARKREREAIYERPDALRGEALARKLAGFRLDGDSDADPEQQAIADARALG